jgi:hypothetical protein
VETNEKKGTFLLNVREEGEVCISKLVSGLLFFDRFKQNLCTSSIWTISQFIFKTIISHPEFFLFMPFEGVKNL